jgi:homoserine O-acetyltransferase
MPVRSNNHAHEIEILETLPTADEPRFESGVPVKKRAFTIPRLTLESGAMLRDVRMGYETYGHLNATGDNAILICHYFAGSSHCAGRYHESDPEPGYWDLLIGPGKPIDTDRFFVVSCDALCNLNPKNPLVVTTGPASINPDTGRVWGADFPVISMGDIVEAQKSLADALGIRRFHAVGGPSMGGFQAMEWAARFPEMVERVISAISGGLDVEPYLIATLDTWTSPLTLDPKFRGGHYHETGEEPIDGLTHAYKLLTLNSLHHDWALRLFNRRWSDPDKDPALSLENHYAIESALERAAQQSAQTTDANSFLRTVRAVQLYSISARKERLRSAFLMIPAQSDLLLIPRYAKRAVTQLQSLGLKAQLFELEGHGGHFDGVNRIAQAAEAIRAFLKEPPHL